MKVILFLPKILLAAGWLLFWWSLVLPFNTSLGGLNNAGTPQFGFLNLFYSIVSIMVVIPVVFNQQDGLAFVLSTILNAGVGICNLVMIISPLIWLADFKNKFLAKYFMVVCAVYVCLFGTVVNYHFYPLRHGHYIWCLSFITVAYAFVLKIINKNALS
jgi:hypothetical protein